MKKGELSIAEYAGKMRALGDELSIHTNEIISYILARLDEVVTSLVARVEPLTYADVYSQLLSFEHRLELLRGGAEAHHAANWAGHRCGGQRGRGGRTGGGSSGRTDGGPSGHNGGNRGHRCTGGMPRQNQDVIRNDVDNRPRCQVCKRRGHQALDCWHRYDENYVPDERYA